MWGPLAYSWFRKPWEYGRSLEERESVKTDLYETSQNRDQTKKSKHGRRKPWGVMSWWQGKKHFWKKSAVTATESSGTLRTTRGLLDEEAIVIFTTKGLYKIMRQKSDWIGLKTGGRFSKSQ